MESRHVPLYQREIQDLLCASSGITGAAAEPVRKYKTMSLRPQSTKLEYSSGKRTAHDTLLFSGKWFDQFAVSTHPSRENSSRPQTAGAIRQRREGAKDSNLRKLFKIAPPPYKSTFSERPIPFRPNFCGTKKSFDKEDPFIQAKMELEAKTTSKASATEHKVKQFDGKKIFLSHKKRPSSAGQFRDDKNVYDVSSKAVLIPIGTQDQRQSSNPRDIHRRLQDTNSPIRRKDQTPYQTAREAAIADAGGSILNTVVNQGDNFNDQQFESPGVFVEGSIMVPHESVGAISLLAHRFCESMKTKDYSYVGNRDGAGKGGVNIQLLVQSSQLHRLMSALQSLDAGVKMKLTMKTNPAECPKHLQGEKEASSTSVPDSTGVVEFNVEGGGKGGSVLWDSTHGRNGKPSNNKDLAASMLKTLSSIAKSEKGGWLPPTLHHMSIEEQEAKLVLSHDLKEIARSVPTPAPKTLDVVAPNLQKAVLWPEKAAQKKYREKFPPKYVQKERQKAKDATMITSTAFARNLCRAARLGDRPSVNGLLQQHKHNKGWVNAKCEDGTTALHHAADAGELEIVKDLLKQGAEKAIIAPSLGTSLQVAKKNLQRSISLKKTNIEECRMIACLLKSTSIHSAAKEGDEVRLQYLHENHGIALDLPNKYGMTPMHLAAVAGHVNACKYLHNICGNNILRTKNNLDQTPLDIGTPDVIAALEEKDLLFKKEVAFIKKHHRIEEERQQEDERCDRMAWESARGTPAAIPLAQRMRNRAIVRENNGQMKTISSGKSSQSKGVYSSGVPSPSRYMRAGKNHTTTDIAKRTRKQGMMSDRAFGDRHPAQGTSKLRHVRQFCRSDQPKDVLAAFHAYDRRVKPGRATGHPKTHDRNFDKWISFHFGQVRA